jgi:hypothetical protein
MLLACLFIVLAIGPADAQPKRGDPAWVPPGLSNEERAEWKNGRPPGWSHGAKRGWRGKDCPPGLAKKGRCPDGGVTSAAPSAATDPLTEALERLRKWGRERRLSDATMAAVLTGFEGAVRHGVPIPIAERIVTIAAERGVTPYGIEAVTRATAYGAERGAPLPELQKFAEHGFTSGAAPDAIALGIYRLAAEARR